MRKLLLPAALALIVFGLRECYRERALHQAAASFIEAVLEGRPQAARSMLVPVWRNQLAIRPRETALAESWSGPEAAQVAYRTLERRGGRAVVEVSIQRSGFSLRPRLHFVEQSDGWKVSAIENLGVDPRWEAFQAYRARLKMDELAEQLSAALSSAPGATAALQRR